jgi:hypothetical protein
MKTVTFASIGVMLAVCAVASASTVTQIIQGEINNQIAVGKTAPFKINVSDSSFETIIQHDGNTTIDVGDSLRGILKVQEIGNHNMNDAVDHELTAIFQVKVVDKQSFGVGGVSQFVFGPDSSFTEAQNIGLGGSAMVIFYEDPSPDWTAGAGPMTTDELSAYNPAQDSLFMAAGMTGSYGPSNSSVPLVSGNPTDSNDWTTNDEFWVSGGNDTPSSLTGTDTGKFYLNILNPTPPAITDSYIFGTADNSPVGTNSAVGLFGNTGFNANAQYPSSPWPIDDTTSFNLAVTQVVPLPAAMWAGAPLLAGLVFLKRRMTA